MPENSENIKKRKPISSHWISIAVKIIILAVAVFCVWNFVGQAFILHDNNMYPHLKDGDLLIISKNSKIKKNDIVLYLDGEDKRAGRVVGSENDTIDIDENGLYQVNGYTPYENTFYRTQTDETSIEFPYTVPSGSYFILNDMRDNTKDSRRFGAIDKKDIIGSVVFISRHREF